LKIENDPVLQETYEKLLDLERRGINGIWARIIKNAFAPLFMGKFDFVAGNPPWINWEALPDNYREQTKSLWQSYGLFSLSGQDARLGGGKKDLSMLMTYVSVDKYLKDKGKLCFVITQSLFKSEGAGDGFRRFQIGKDGKYFKMLHLDDMVSLQPFEDTTNRTAIVMCSEGEKTTYPVPYTVWQKNGKGKIKIDISFDEVLNLTSRRNWSAFPVDDKTYTSPWIAGRPKALIASQKVIGNSDYIAHEGVNTGGANSVYWINVIGASDKTIKVENLCDIGNKKVQQVSMDIEPNLVFPLLRGRDTKRWSAIPSLQIIVSQDPKTRMGYQEKWMKHHLPLTYEYFKVFEDFLWTRKSSSVRTLMEQSSFYSMFAVANYTFSPYKVVWKYIAQELTCAVISSETNQFLGDKIVIPDCKLILIGLDTKDESHYLCAMLNSSPARYVVKSYAIGTQLAPHILKRVNVPSFDPNNQIHKRLNRISLECHEKTAAGIDVSDLETQIDELAAELWGLTKDELKEIQESLREM
jgi:hypothetical protein